MVRALLLCVLCSFTLTSSIKESQRDVDEYFEKLHIDGSEMEAHVRRKLFIGAMLDSKPGFEGCDPTEVQINSRDSFGNSIRIAEMVDPCAGLDYNAGKPRAHSEEYEQLAYESASDVMINYGNDVVEAIGKLDEIGRKTKIAMNIAGHMGGPMIGMAIGMAGEFFGRDPTDQRFDDVNLKMCCNNRRVEVLEMQCVNNGLAITELKDAVIRIDQEIEDVNQLLEDEIKRVEGRINVFKANTEDQLKNLHRDVKENTFRDMQDQLETWSDGMAMEERLVNRISSLEGGVADMSEGTAFDILERITIHTSQISGCMKRMPVSWWEIDDLPAGTTTTEEVILFTKSSDQCDFMPDVLKLLAEVSAWFIKSHVVAAFDQVVGDMAFLLVSAVAPYIDVVRKANGQRGVYLIRGAAETELGQLIEVLGSISDGVAQMRDSYQVAWSKELTRRAAITTKSNAHRAQPHQSLEFSKANNLLNTITYGPYTDRDTGRAEIEDNVYMAEHNYYSSSRSSSLRSSCYNHCIANEDCDYYMLEQTSFSKSTVQVPCSVENIEGNYGGCDNHNTGDGPTRSVRQAIVTWHCYLYQKSEEVNVVACDKCMSNVVVRDLNHEDMYEFNWDVFKAIIDTNVQGLTELKEDYEDLFADPETVFESNFVFYGGFGTADVIIVCPSNRTPWMNGVLHGFNNFMRSAQRGSPTGVALTDCIPQPAVWHTSDWSLCSTCCGGGVQSRTNTCSTGRSIDCTDNEPLTEQACHTESCRYYGPTSGRCVQMSVYPVGSSSSDWNSALQEEAEEWCDTNADCVGYMHTTQASRSTQWHGRPQFCSAITHSGHSQWEYWLKQSWIQYTTFEETICSMGGGDLGHSSYDNMNAEAAAEYCNARQNCGGYQYAAAWRGGAKPQFFDTTGTGDNCNDNSGWTVYVKTEAVGNGEEVFSNKVMNNFNIEYGFWLVVFVVACVFVKSLFGSNSKKNDSQFKLLVEDEL